MKTYQEKIERNRLFTIIAMAVIAIVIIGTFWFQNSSEPNKASISQKSEDKTITSETKKDSLQQSSEGESITVEGKITSLTFAE